MGCWKWFDRVLDEAGVRVTSENEGRIEGVIHGYIGEQSRYGRCSPDWKKARKEIQDNPAMRRELVEKLRSTA